MPNFPQNPYPGQVVSWQGYEYQWNGEQWINLAFPNPAIVPVYVSASAPQPPIIPGSLWFNTLTFEMSVWVQQSGTYVWQPALGNPPEQPFVYVSASPPSNPIEGTLWYDPADYTLSVWVTSGVTDEWRVISSQEPSPANPASVIVSSSPPINPTQGLLWFNPLTNLLQAWVITLSGSSWRSLSGSNTLGKPTVLVSTSAPPNPSQGDLWFNPNSKILKVWNVFLSSGSWIETYPCDLLTAAASAEESAEQAAASAALAEYYAEQAGVFLSLTLIDSSQTGIIYVGKAPLNSPESSPVWKITKSTFNDSGVLLTEQTATNVPWTDRYIVPYS